tara:strand:+ start:87 stop:509 length:423 start_codon:yes stop_codon:yes gene_type:complete
MAYRKDLERTALMMENINNPLQIKINVPRRINTKSKVGDKETITKYDKSGNIKKTKTITKVSDERNEGHHGLLDNPSAYTGVKRIDVEKPGKYGDEPMVRSRYKKMRTFKDAASNVGGRLSQIVGFSLIGNAASKGAFRK